MKHIEVEQKYELPDAVALVDRLTASGATAGEPNRQVDTYLNPPDRDFTAPEVITEWLRIRTSPHGSSLNFKRWHNPGRADAYADEHESPVGDVDAIERTFAALGFTELVTVDKTRTTYRLDDVEVAVDTLSGAGAYVEFEFKGDAASTDDAHAHLEKFIADLGVELGGRVHRGYPHILLGRDG